MARGNAGKTMYQITGNPVTNQQCVNKPTGTDLSKVPKTDRCWTDYYATIAALSAAANITISDPTDPWGRPYFLDENEGVNGECYQDTVAMYTYPFVQQYTPDYRVQNENVPLSGYTGCTTPQPH